VNRRRFILSAALSLAAPRIGAQQGKVVRIGVITSTAMPSSFRRSFGEGLRERGYIDGRDVIIEWRSADGDVERAKTYAAELVKRPVDVIVAHFTPAAQAASKATRTIPIVMSGVGDPVSLGLVRTLARPGGNVTGFSLNSAELNGKRIALLRELLPRLRTLGLLVNASDPFSGPFVEESREPAKKLNVALRVIDLGRTQDLDAALANIKKARIDAVMVQGILMSRGTELAASAVKHRIAAASPAKQFAQMGGLMAYGADFNDLMRRTAGYVDKILKGAKPADLPVEQPSKFELVINLRTARQLAIPLSRDFLATVDEVIQ